ncbi:MAG: hypothetical protein KC466_05410, partial [Myxococcales bacterium]|nr:hypothetical protein [Myxococcales bacterium]
MEIERKIPGSEPAVEAVIAKLRGPFRTFSKNHFANLPKLQAFEAFVRAIATDARREAKGEPARRFLDELVDTFTGFDELAPLDRREAFARGIRVVERFVAGEFAPKLVPKAVPLDAEGEGDEAPRPEGLATPIQFVKGVGPHVAQLLERKGIATVGDTLDFLPRKYLDRRNLKTIADVKAGEEATVAGTIVNTGMQSTRAGKIWSITIRDATGELELKWFRFKSGYLAHYLAGTDVVVSGVPREYRGRMEIHHPEIEAFDPGDEALHHGRIIPVYSETEGLGQRRLRRILKEVVDRYARLVPDPLPPEVIARLDLLTRA